MLQVVCASRVDQAIVDLTHAAHDGQEERAHEHPAGR
jgi:hypothetical protein